MIVKSCKSGRCGTAVLTLLPPAREREAEVSGSVAFPGSQPTLNASVQRRFLLCCASASLLIVGRKKMKPAGGKCLSHRKDRSTAPAFLFSRALKTREL